MSYPAPPKKPFDYGGLIKDTLGLVWRYKFLWFFGLFAGTGSSLGSWNFNFSTDTSDSEEAIPSEAADWINDHLTLVIALIAVAIFIGILFWLWSIYCQGSVINSVRDIRKQKTASFRSALRYGKESFGRLLLFNLFILGITAGVLIILGALAVFFFFLIVSGNAGETIAAILGSALAAGIISLLIMSFGYLTVCTAVFILPILLNLLLTFSIRAVVLERKRPVKALRRGFRVLMDNLSRSLLLFLLSIGLSIGAGIIGVMVLAISAIPAVIAWIITYNVDFALPGIIISSLLSLLVLVVGILMAALFNTYFATFWTITYLNFTDTGEAPPEQEVTTAAPLSTFNK